MLGSNIIMIGLNDSISKGEKQEEEKYEVGGDTISGETMAAKQGRLNKGVSYIYDDVVEKR